MFDASFEHEFCGDYKRKITVKEVKIILQEEGRGERSKKKMSCYKTLNQFAREDLNVCDFRFFRTLQWIELYIRTLV